MLDKDYYSYDFIDIIVKKENQQEIVDAYSTFLWEKIEEKEDKRYNDIVHLSFRRDIKILNKDRLAYLQVSYETALNKKAEIKFKKHSKSIASICNLAFFSLAGLLGVGVFIYFYKSILSIVLGGLSALCILTLDSFIIKRIKKRFSNEKIKYQSEIEIVEKEIKEILSKVEKLAKEKKKIQMERKDEKE